MEPERLGCLPGSLCGISCGRGSFFDCVSQGTHGFQQTQQGGGVADKSIALIAQVVISHFDIERFSWAGAQARKWRPGRFADARGNGGGEEELSLFDGWP